MCRFEEGFDRSWAHENIQFEKSWLHMLQSNISFDLTQQQFSWNHGTICWLKMWTSCKTHFFFHPIHIVFHHRGCWSFELFVSFQAFIHFFLKLKSQSQRFQLEKCGASECIHFNGREWSPECCRRVLLKVLLSL